MHIAVISAPSSTNANSASRSLKFLTLSSARQTMTAAPAASMGRALCHMLPQTHAQKRQIISSDSPHTSKAPLSEHNSMDEAVLLSLREQTHISSALTQTSSTTSNDKTEHTIVCPYTNTQNFSQDEDDELQCWACWETTNTPNDPLIRVCRGCKDIALQYIHQSCVDKYISNLPTHDTDMDQRGYLVGDDIFWRRLDGEMDNDEDKEAFTVWSSLTGIASTISNNAATTVRSALVRACAYLGRDAEPVAAILRRVLSRPRRSQDLFPPATIQNESTVNTSQAERAQLTKPKYYCTRCKDPYNAVDIPIHPMRIIYRDRVLFYIMIIMSICVIILTLCCTSLLVSDPHGTRTLLVIGSSFVAFGNPHAASELYSRYGLPFSEGRTWRISVNMFCIYAITISHLVHLLMWRYIWWCCRGYTTKRILPALIL